MAATEVNFTSQTQGKPVDFTDVGEIAKNWSGKAVNQAEEMQKKNPGLFDIAKKLLLGAIAILSLIFNPLSTIIGFGVGFLFSEKVNAVVEKVKEWFNNAGPLGKAGMILLGAASALFLPTVFGLGTGAAAGSTTAQWAQSSKSNPTRAYV